MNRATGRKFVWCLSVFSLASGCNRAPDVATQDGTAQRVASTLSPQLEKQRPPGAPADLPPEKWAAWTVQQRRAEQAQAAPQATAAASDRQGRVLDEIAAIKRVPFAQLQPLEGRGVLVFEPQAPVAMANFGAGCGRWLHLQVSGQNAFGRTPLWGAPDSARYEAGFPNLRLNASQARRIGRATGVSHVAVGQLSGRGEKLKLRYELLSIDGTSHGAWMLGGSRDGLRNALPGLARSMIGALKTPPEVPSRVELTASELEFVGGTAWSGPWRASSAAQQARLRALASRSTLAAVLAFRLKLWRDVADFANLRAALPLMEKEAPRNALILASWARDTGDYNAPSLSILQASARKWPNNYVIASALMRRCAKENLWPQSQAWAETAVRAAPGYAGAWLDMNETLKAQAEAIRQSRFSNDISPVEGAQLDKLYGLAWKACERAVKLSPRRAQAWQELSSAATFGGDQALAISALWRAVQLGPDDSNIYAWGFQIFQPKWFDQPAQLLKLARLAASRAKTMEVPAAEMVHALRAAGLHSQVVPILETCLRRDPRNIQARDEFNRAIMEST